MLGESTWVQSHICDGASLLGTAIATLGSARQQTKSRSRILGANLPKQALKAAEDAEDSWVTDSADSRKEALQCAQAASDFAAHTYKHLRLVHDA